MKDQPSQVTKWLIQYGILTFSVMDTTTLYCECFSTFAAFSGGGCRNGTVNLILEYG